MGVYIAPEIKDRVAVGDDLYQIADSDGKKKLIPDPTSVSEVGTAINKALLQPLVDALQAATETLSPYDQYWWRRRSTASGYSEARIKSSEDGSSDKTASHWSSTDKVDKYYVSARVDIYPSEGSSEKIYATLQYSSSLDINQSTGAVSLKNPSTYTVTVDDAIYSSSFYSRFQGKYVKGFIWCTDVIFYIPPTAYMKSESWGVSGDTRYYYGYEFTADSTRQPMRITSVKNTTVGSWETVSSSVSDAYPKSGVSGGYEWAYVGKIYENVLSLLDTTRARYESIGVTSANFSDDEANIALNVKKALICIGSEGALGTGGVFGYLDMQNHIFLGVAIDDGNSIYTRIRAVQSGETIVKTSSGSSAKYITLTDTGLSFTGGTYACTIYFLPLDSLEEGK